MAAPQKQKKASASAGRTTAKRGPVSRASSPRSSGASRSNSSRTSSTSARGTARSQASARTGGRRTGAGKSNRSSSARASARSPIAAIAIVGAIIVAAWAIYPVYKLQYEHRQEVRTLEEELGNLKERNGELREEVDGLKTPEGVEQVARDTLGLVKPGEQAYVVTGGTIGETSTTVMPDGEGDTPVWQGVLDALFGLD